MPVFAPLPRVNEAPADIPNASPSPTGWRTVPLQCRQHSFGSLKSVSSIKECVRRSCKFKLRSSGHKCKGDGCEKYMCRYCRFGPGVRKGRGDRRR